MPKGSFLECELVSSYSHAPKSLALEAHGVSLKSMLEPTYDARISQSRRNAPPSSSQTPHEVDPCQSPRNLWAAQIPWF